MKPISRSALAVLDAENNAHQEEIRALVASLYGKRRSIARGQQDAFRYGARGWLIKEIQKSVAKATGASIAADGAFGNQTKNAVIALQKANRLQETGFVAEKELMLCGMTWPCLFMRCLNLTSVFEGTNFGGAEGPAQTGDNYGVTYGLIGFTSGNLELQKFLADYISTYGVDGSKYIGAAAWNKFAASTGSQDRNDMERLCLKNGSVLPEYKVMFAAWGDDPNMRKLQMERARDVYWNIAVRQADFLSIDARSNRHMSLLYDIAVQNGGLKKAEMLELNTPPSLDELADIIVRRVASKSQTIVRAVYRRKKTIANGSGIVNGDVFDLANYAL